MFSKRKEMKRKVVKSFPILLALFSAQVLLTVGENGEKIEETDEEMKCVCDGVCEHLRESDCPWGLTLDVCGCCFLCARGENEPCAGPHGTCAIGLRCELNLLKNASMTREGICTRSNESCIDPVRSFGCSVEGGKCICGERFGCPDEEMFLFDTEDSCRSQTASLIARKDLEPLYPSVSATENCREVQCPKVKECPHDSYRHPILVDSSHESCCPTLPECFCNPGLVCPTPTPCPGGWLSSTVTIQTGKPGNCCPTYECKLRNGVISTKYESCIFHGQKYENGQSWSHGADDCTECNCQNRVVSCQPHKCNEIHPECKLVKALSGSCCPVCAGCISNAGKVYNNSDIWEDEEDPCTTCTCVEGRIRCNAAMCQTTCSKPTHIPGECCPRCDKEQETTCPFMECGELECPNGFRLDETGCPTCKCITCRSLAECNKECEFGFETNGEGCRICRCQRKESIHVHDHEIKRPTKPPEGDFGLDCDPDTAGLDGGVIRGNGEEWSENCRRCICKNGSKMCSLVTCPQPKCKNPIIFPGSCCPKCSGEYTEQFNIESAISICQSSDGIQYVDGEMWKLGDCLTCTCHNGQVFCAAPECPPTPCEMNSMQKEGNCCLTCLLHNNSETGLSLNDKNFSSPSTLNCFSDDSQKIYTHGEMWKVEACQSCICENGQVHCFSGGKCSALECERPILVKNQCCPICLGGNIIKEFSLPPKWYPKKDINSEDGESSSSRETSCVIIISVLLSISLILVLFIARTYFSRSRIRLAENTPLNSSTTTTPPLTPECCYKYKNCIQLSEQKTPLRHNTTSRNTSLILNIDANTDKV